MLENSKPTFTLQNINARPHTHKRENFEINVENVFSTNNPQILQLPFSCLLAAQKYTLVFESQMKNGPLIQGQQKKQGGNPPKKRKNKTDEP